MGIQPEFIEFMNRMIPLGRGGTPGGAAGAVYLMCIPESDYISGEVVLASGGFVCSSRQHLFLSTKERRHEARKSNRNPVGADSGGIAISPGASENRRHCSSTGPAAFVGIPQKNSVALLPKKIGDTSIEYLVFG